MPMVVKLQGPRQAIRCRSAVDAHLDVLPGAVAHELSEGASAHRLRIGPGACQGISNRHLQQ